MEETQTIQKDGKGNDGSTSLNLIDYNQARKLTALEEDTAKTLLTDLTSLAHKLDQGKAALASYEEALAEYEKADLESRKGEVTGASATREGPSRLLVRHFEHVKQMRAELARNLMVYENQLTKREAQCTADDVNDAVVKYVRGQQAAILAMASRVSVLKKHHDELRDDISRKLNLNPRRLDDALRTPDMAQEIKAKYRRFVDEMKRKLKERNEECDLSGALRQKNAPTTGTSSGFGGGFGGGFGKSGGSFGGFGSTSTTAGKSGGGFGGFGSTSTTTGTTGGGFGGFGSTSTAGKK